MLDILKSRLRWRKRTLRYPAAPLPALFERYKGRPVLNRSCPADCRDCLDICPVAALQKDSERLILDLGRCIFCGQCETSCPAGVLTFSKDYQLAVTDPRCLLLGQDSKPAGELNHPLAKRLYGRSLKLRQVSAGGCNACEADCNVLDTPVWDIGRLGIQYAASPRHADALLVTGPVTRNMHTALLKTYAALAEPRLVIAVGSCAISGGIYREHTEVCGGVQAVLPVDLFIPGCPPHPATILDGLLRLMYKSNSPVFGRKKQRPNRR